LKVFVKICGITNEEDALLATALGTDALGFIFAPSSRRVSVERARDVVKRLPLEVLPVGVFKNDRPEHVVDVAARVGLHAVQLSGSEPLSEVRWIRERVRFVIQGYAAGDPALAAAANSPADVVLVDSPSPGSGKVFDWRLAEGAPGGVRVMVAGGLNPDNVAEAIRRIRPWGVDVATGVEVAPGRKDPRKLRRFIEAARGAGNDVDDRLVSTPNNEWPNDERPNDEQPNDERDHVGGVSRPWDWQLDD
jgi:phosphoribosylanthranilate isomerase